MSKFRIILSFILLDLFFLPAIAEAEETQYPNGMVAIVEDKVITAAELQRHLSAFIPQLQRESRSQEEFVTKIEDAGRQILERMINEKLLVCDFYDRGAKIPDAYLNNHIASVIKERFDGDRAKLNATLQAQGLNMRDFRKQQEEDIIVGYLQGELHKSQSEISPDKIENFYQEHREEFKQEDAVNLYQIALIPKAGETEDDLIQRSQDLLRELRAGKPLDQLEKQYADKTEGASNKLGTDWGWVNRKDIREELAQSAFNLNQGEYGEPVKIDDRFYILHVKDRLHAGMKPLKEVSDFIAKQIIQDLAQKTQDNKIKRLRKKYFIKSYL